MGWKAAGCPGTKLVAREAAAAADKAGDECELSDGWPGNPDGGGGKAPNVDGVEGVEPEE